MQLCLDNSFNGMHDMHGRYRKLSKEQSKNFRHPVPRRKEDSDGIISNTRSFDEVQYDRTATSPATSPPRNDLPPPLLPNRVMCYDNMAVDVTESEKKLPMYDAVTESSVAKQWSVASTGDETWFASFPTQSSDSEKTTASLLEALKLSSMQEAMRPSYTQPTETKPKLQLAGNEFEDLKFEMIQRFGLTKNPITTAPVTNSDAIVNTSFSNISNEQKSSPLSKRRPRERYDVAPSPPPYNTRRDIAAIASKYNYVPSQNSSSIAIPRPTSRPGSGQLPRRSLSVNSSGSDVWADIPPLVPPREPVRPSRISPSLNLSHSSGSSKSSKDTSPVEPPRSQIKPCTASVFSAVPPSGTADPMILPIIKNGVQDSHTHYFLLSDKQANKFKRSTSCSANVPAARVAPFTHSRDSTDNSPVSTPTTSRVRRSYSHLSPSQKCAAVQREVFGVTDEECVNSLKLNLWDVGKAIKNLKVEQVFLMGIAPREKCQQVLQAANWDLEMASSILFDEYKRNHVK